MKGTVQRTTRLLAALVNAHEAGLEGYQMGLEALRVVKFARCGLSLASLVSKPETTNQRAPLALEEGHDYAFEASLPSAIKSGRLHDSISGGK